jgi:uncharacterized protein involved in exopolysaccharide biosynthesis
VANTFDAYEYLRYLRSRWRFLAVAGAASALAALAISLLLSNKYTACARILIDPPAGLDSRSAMAVSPTYLESLRTYEHLAASDSCFWSALEKFHLRERFGARPFESLKRSVLQVSIPRSTRILEICVTLPDAKIAHAVAAYMAEETVKLHRTLAEESDREFSAGVEKQFAEALTARQSAEAELARFLAREPVPELESETESQQEMISWLRRQALAAEVDASEYDDQVKRSGPAPRGDATAWLAESRARAGYLRRQIQELETALRGNQKILAERRAKMSVLEMRRESSQAAFAPIEARLREVRSSLGYRGERLAVVDPGIVPERPAFPNVPLNVLGAFALALIAAWLWLSIEFGYRLRAAP